MSHFRFSLLGLAGLVTLIALGCASLAYASAWLSGVAWSATFLLLAFATLAAVLRSPPHRSWWIGFALFGWMNILTVVGPLAGLSAWLQVDRLLERAASTMPRATVTTTTAAMDPFQSAFAGGMGMPGAAMPGAAMPGTGPPGMGAATNTVQILDTGYIFAFVRTSQALLTLLLACLGGFAAKLIHERNRFETQKLIQERNRFETHVRPSDVAPQ